MNKYTRATIFGLIVFFLLANLNCLSTRGVNTGPDLRGLNEAIKLFMTGPEKDIYKSLRDEAAKQEFIQDFWIKRDPDLMTDENEFKIEFEQRLAYVNNRFKGEGIPGWKTDRGRIYMYLGPPDQAYDEPYLNYENVKARLVWVYYKYQLGVEFLDRTGTNKYEMQIIPRHSFRLMWAIERAKFGLVTQEEQLDAGDDDIDLDFDENKKEITVKFPTSVLLFKEEGDYWVLDFRFDFYIYTVRGTKKDRFSETRTYKELKEKVIEMEEIVFSFPYEFSPGNYYLDVKVSDAEGIGQFRKIEKVKTK